MMEKRNNMKKMEEDREILTREEALSSRIVEKLEKPRHDMQSLTNRCSDLLGSNTKLEKQVDILQRKLEEANTTVRGFEERLQKHVLNEGNMKKVVAELRDYLFVFEEENCKLKEEVEALRRGNDKLKIERSEQDLLMLERVKNNEELKSKIDIMNKSHAKNKCNCKETSETYETKIKNLKNEKCLLEERLRSEFVGEEERSNKISQLSESNKRLAHEATSVQEKLDEIFDAKMKLEEELGRKRIECEARESDLIDLRRKCQGLEDKLATRDQQRAAMTQQLKVCLMANEKVDLEKRKSEEDLASANAMITNLENEVNMQKGSCDKYKEELKVRENEISRLTEQCQGLKTGKEEAQLEKEMLRLRLENSEASHKRCTKDINEANDAEKKLRIEFELKKKELDELGVRFKSTEKDLAKNREENRTLEDKINWLVSEGEKLKEMNTFEICNWRKKYEDLVERYDALKNALTQKDNMLETSDKILKQEKEQASKAVRKLNKAVNHFQESDKECKNQLIYLENKRNKLKEDLEGQEKRNIELNEMMNKIKSDNEEKKSEIADMNDNVCQLQKQLQESEKTSKALKKALNKAKIENTETANELRSIKNERIDLCSQISGLEKEVKEFVRKLEEKDSLHETLKTESISYKQELDNTKKIQASNNELISTGKKHIQNLIIEKEELMRRLNEMEHRSQKLEEDKQQLRYTTQELQGNWETVRKQKEGFIKEEEHLRAKHEELLKFIPILEGKVEESSNTIFKLEETNAKLMFEKDSIVLEAKDCEQENQRLRDNEKQLQKKLSEKDKEASTAVNEVEKLIMQSKMKEDAILSLEKQFDELNQKYKNVYNDFIAVCHQKEEEEKELGETKLEIQRINDELVERRENVKELSSKLNSASVNCEEVKKKYIRKNNATKQGIIELRETMKKFEQENDELKGEIKGNLQRIRELEENYDKSKNLNENLMKEKEDWIQSNCGIMDSLKKQIEKQEKDLESLVKENKSISKKLLKMKKNYAQRLTDVLNQRYFIDELSGSHQYEHVQRKRFEKDIESKDEELFELREKVVWYDNELVNLKKLFDSERGLRMEIANDIKKLKSSYEILEDEKIKLSTAKEEMEQQLIMKVSQIKKCLLVEQDNLQQVRQEVDMKARELEKGKIELAKERETIYRLETMVNDARQECDAKNACIMDLEQQLQALLDARNSLSKIIEGYEGKNQRNETQIKSMQMMHSKAEMEINELQDKLKALEKETRFLEKAKDSSDTRLRLLEANAREVEKKYKIRCNEEYDLRESLKGVRSEYLSLLQEKETIEEQKHKLELKLIQGDSRQSKKGKERSNRDCHKSIVTTIGGDNKLRADGKIFNKEAFAKERDPMLDETLMKRYENDFKFLGTCHCWDDTKSDNGDDEDEELAAIMRL